MTDNANPLIVIASNRGPFSFKAKKDGKFTVDRGAGGLVTALSALAEQHDVLWVASALSRGDFMWGAKFPDGENVQGINLRLILPNKRQYDMYYNTVSNPLLWFIQHQLWDAPRQPVITRDTWMAWREGYVNINRQFAETIADSVRDAKRPVIVFPQDYHLYMVPHFLRELLGDQVQIQPFVHIPWPSPDGWRMLPEEIRRAILDSLAVSDRVGFQTRRDAFNFVQCCRLYLHDAHSHGSRDSITYKERKVEAKTYPISIDVDKVKSLSGELDTQAMLAEISDYTGDRKLILRTDRIEPSKNIIRGLEAFHQLLELHPEHQGKVQMLALLVPSRMEVDEYQSYLQEIMATAGYINATHSEASWEPVRIILGDNYKRAIAAMQLYDVLLVNPIADGMNLVAKEGVLVNKKDGMLILSEHAGAYYELGEYSLTVSPFDVYSTAEAMHYALNLPREKRKQHATALREIVESAGVREWFYNQVRDALHALSNQSRNDSTPETPETSKSASA